MDLSRLGAVHLCLEALVYSECVALLLDYVEFALVGREALCQYE